MSKKTFKTSDEVSAKIAQVKQECADLETRHDKIEQAIAKNWDSDTTSLQTEYAGLTAKLKAASRVLDTLQAQWLELYTSEHVAIFESKSEAAYNARNEAQALTAQANELQAQVDDLRRQAAAQQKHHDSWCDQSPYWLEDRQKEGIKDLSGFVEVVNKYQLPSHMRHWTGGWDNQGEIAAKKRQAG